MADSFERKLDIAELAIEYEKKRAIRALARTVMHKALRSIRDPEEPAYQFGDDEEIDATILASRAAQKVKAKAALRLTRAVQSHLQICQKATS